jgi:hypothetical protein
MERDKMPDSREGLLNLLQEWLGFAEWACNIHNSRQSRYAYLNFIFGNTHRRTLNQRGWWDHSAFRGKPGDHLPGSYRGV